MQPYPKDFAIYWDGPVSKHSIKEVKLKKNGEVSALVQKRDAWVDHLYDCAEETTARCNEEWKKQAPTSRARYRYSPNTDTVHQRRRRSTQKR